MDRTIEAKYETVNINATKREDAITRKYREIYGTSLISKSKDNRDRSNSRKKQPKNY